MSDEKPKRKPKRFPGMKKQPKYGNPHKNKKKYGPFSKEMKIKPGLSVYQKRTMKEFMEVRPGETLDQWRRRTAKRRVLTDEELKDRSHTHPLKIRKRSRERNAIENKNKYLVVRSVEREFDFMRYYGIVCNYYAIKHSIRKEDIEVGLYFFSNIPFTRGRFENALVLMTGNNQAKLARFINEGLIEEVLHKTISPFTKKEKYSKSNYFRLTKPFVRILTEMYRVLGKMNGIVTYKQPISGLPEEVKKIIMEMNEEIQDIMTSRKPQQSIKNQ